MRVLSKHTRMASLLASLTVAALVGLAVLAPTGASAASNSLTVATTDAYMKGSCDFAVTRNNDFDSVTARLTMKAVEVKPLFSARRVASATAVCMVRPIYGVEDEQDRKLYFKTNQSGSTIYKSQYITADWAPKYELCAQVLYTLRTGAEGETPFTCFFS